MSRYAFLARVSGEGYGGLEHRASSVLSCRRDDLPQPGVVVNEAGYRRFLGLVSHEYFHAWHVKRIRPAEFVDADLGAEVYTHQLWIFEGITSYYDDLALRRSGLITVEQYLEMLGQVADPAVPHGGTPPPDPGGGQLRCLDQVLPARRELAECHRQLLPEGRPGGAGPGPGAALPDGGHLLAGCRHAHAVAGVRG